jgi:hypothetical protein
LLIDATCAPADIRHPDDLSLLNVDAVFSEGVSRELTETLIDAMHSKARESFGHKPRTHRRQVRQQFLAMAKKSGQESIRSARRFKQQLGHLKRNLVSIDALTACGASLLEAGRYANQKLLVVSELSRHQKILYQSDIRSITGHIVSLSQAHDWPIMRGKARCNVEFGAKISLSLTGEGFTLLDRLSFVPYNKG